MLSVGELRGLWRRTRLERAGEPADCTTRVLWLQGPAVFVDLRQPPQRPSFAGVACVRDLQAEHLVWLALQQGFAGTLTIDAEIAHWTREIDFQPDTGVQDRAHLRRDGDVLTERGTECSYLEMWARDHGPKTPSWGVKLRDAAHGTNGFLARAGDRLMFARDRRDPLPPAMDLTSVLATCATHAARQDALDCELSSGRIDASGESWSIEHSTLPFKEERRYAIQLGALLHGRFFAEDVAPDGKPISRHWIVDPSFVATVPV